VSHSDQFWKALKNGKDLVSAIGEDRWGKASYYHSRQKEPGKSYTWSAGVIPDVDRFDAKFFGISPREAAEMDPQQRLLLELTWGALEDGGQVPEALAGSDCAVYVGIASNDYVQRRIDDLSSIDAYTMTGNTASIASNRISYAFDFRGPSLSVDTACSSSLVALHQACSCIRKGDASMAIVGGVNMLLHPFAFIGFSKASMLSPTGRCRPFDVAGDGYVRAEGSAVLVLKPLGQAEADGDPIHAVILSSGVNCDGRTNGITVPSAEGQADLLNSVYKAAGVEPEQIAYLEAHGTGTPVGDPIEAAAIGQILGAGRKQNNPLPIGSVKSNLGHLETASGMAGLVKVVECLKNRAIPASINYDSPNPNIDFDHLNLRVVTEYTSLPKSDKPLLMGVNSFGFGGANAHVLLENHPSSSHVSCSSTAEQVVPPLFLSAQSDEALKEMAGAYHDLLKQANAPEYYDTAYTAAFHRQHLNHGLALFGRDKMETIELLQAVHQGKSPPRSVQTEKIAKPAKLALVFSGNGSQWLGMGRQLLENEPLFRQTIEEVDSLLGSRVDYSLVDELMADPADSKMHYTEIAQTALFALQAGIMRLLWQKGLQADAVFGHSAGEITAAWAAGALTLEQAVQIIYERSSAQGVTKGSGRMAAVALSADQVIEVLEAAGLSESIEVAAINSPHSVTLSGPLSDLESLKGILKKRGSFLQLLDLDYAFHSRYMDPVKEQILASLDGLKPSPVKTRFISTVTGAEMGGEALGASYWWENIRQPVQFSKAVETLLNDDCRVFLEISPNPIMQGHINKCFKDQGVKGRVLGTLKRDADDSDRLLGALCTSYLLGCPLDLDLLFPTKGAFVSLPSYPWQRERYWYPLTNEGYDLINKVKDHLLLGSRLKLDEPEWENQLDSELVDYLADHVVGGAEVFPAAGYVEMALAASKSWFQIATHEIEGLEIRAPLVLDHSALKTVRFILVPEDGRFIIKSRVRLSDDPWTINAVGRLSGAVLQQAPEKRDLSRFIPQDIPRILVNEHYDLANKIGLSYGAAFQAVAEVWPRQMQAFARIEIPQKIAAGIEQHILHPSLLDACFQVLIDIFKNELTDGAMIPVRIGRLRFYGMGGRAAFLHARVTNKSQRAVVADFQLLDKTGNVLVELEACRFRGVMLSRTKDDPALYEFLPQLKPHQGIVVSTSFPPIENLVSHAIGNAKKQEKTLGRAAHFQQALPLFDGLACAFAYQTFKELGADEGTFSLDSLVKLKKIHQRYKPLLARLLSMLQEDELVHSDGDEWFLFAADELPVAEDIWLTLLGDYPAYLPELLLAGRCGSQLTALLKGGVEAEAILASKKDGSTLEHLYESTPSYMGVNIAVRAIVEKIVRDWPANRRLRILEIGGGGGGLTTHLLPILPQRQCDYLFTDVDENVLARAEMEFAAYPFVEVSLFDPEIAIDSQPSVISHGYDIVIAGNVLHEVDDFVGALVNVKRLLPKNGLLILLERHPDRFTDMTFGIKPDWWAHTSDAELPVSPLLTPNEWQSVLQESGFADVEPFIEPESVASAGAFLMLAKNPDLPLQNEEQKAAAPLTWLIMLDRGDQSWSIGQHLAAWLQSQSQAVITVEAGDDFQELSRNHFSIDPVSAGQFITLLDTLKKRGTVCDHIIHLMGFSFVDDQNEIDLEVCQEQRCLSTLHLLKALEQVASTPNLSLITSGGAVISAEMDVFNHVPSQAPLWGLGRVIMNEYPALNCKLIDLQRGQDLYSTAQLLLLELLDPDAEDEIIITEQSRYVVRMHPTSLRQEEKRHAEQDKADICLDFSTPGPLKHLYWRTLATNAPASDEIAIRPRATGLNFRDVMYAMGLLPDEAVESGYSGATLGMELAGDVVAVGSAVTDYKIGDQVIGFAPSCFSTRVITKASAAALKPAHWTYEAAATVPTTFFTAYYALQHLAQLQPGERVLIHGAAGGVGIAAIQMAHHLGAEIFATAGSDEKRDFVRLLGVDHVMDSRNLNFAHEIMEITHGEGVDVVLNSLAGDAIAKNFSVLRPFGRFLELGKRDFYENNRIDLRPFRNNISYFGVDADQLMVERSALAHRLFQEMMQLFEEGILRPLPYRVFPATRVADAFRYMQQSKQIGKVVVSFGDAVPVAQNVAPFEASLTLSAKSCYLVTGGLSGFGLKTARWLVDKGAKTLVLIGRSGASTPEAADAVAELKAAGVTIYVRPVDVSNYCQLEKLFSEIEQAFPPLAGIVHAAMVIEDSLMKDMDAEQAKRVLAPKMLGAWNLHRLTEKMPLDFFILYSSATTYFGNPGQANYVAANMYLESLAGYRQDQGLAALAVSWGAISDVGYLAKNEAVSNALQSRMGGMALTSDQALLMLEKLLASGKSRAAVIDFSWGAIQRVMPSARAPKFDELRRYEKDLNQGEHAEDIHDMIANLSEEEVQQLITDLMVREVAQILRFSQDKLPIDQSVFDLGMDSLMGMELVLAIEERFGITLPVMALTEGPTIARLAERVTAHLLAQEDAEEQRDSHPPERDTVDAVVSRHADKLTTEEMEGLVGGLAATTDTGGVTLVQ